MLCSPYTCLRVALLLEHSLSLTLPKFVVVPYADKNEIQDLRDVIAVEQEEKKDMQRKLQNAENECKLQEGICVSVLNWGTRIWNVYYCLIPSVHWLPLDGFIFSIGAVRMTRMKQAEQQRDSISVQHVETLKQKVMKLRKENESLKRRLASSEP
jgi:hypothetical protein